ncbi:hypothetical protein V8C34DRAFT_277498 [Trichoderma compactum]
MACWLFVTSGYVLLTASSLEWQVSVSHSMPKNTLPPMAPYARSIQNSSAHHALALCPPNTGQIKKIRGFRGVASGDHPGRPGGGRYGQSLTPKRSHSPVMSSKHWPLVRPGSCHITSAPPLFDRSSTA